MFRAVWPGSPWVLFEHGTAVRIDDDPPPDDLAAAATALLAEWGPVQAGTPAGDFDVFPAGGTGPWLVTSHHPGVVTYVAADDVDNPVDVMVGLLGRAKRDQDAAECTVVHVEHARSS